MINLFNGKIIIKKFFAKNKGIKIIALFCIFSILAGVGTIVFMNQKGNSGAAWDGSTKKPSGSGTEDNPYIISLPANLAWIAQQTNADSSWSNGKYFKQTADLDLGGVQNSNGSYDNSTSKQWAPISNFRGIYDGGGYKISNLYINSSSYQYAGLFGRIENATIKNVHISSGSVYNSNSNYNTFVGGIVGYAHSSSQIIACSNSANVSATSSSAYAEAGGIAGGAPSTTIIACYNSGRITASSSKGSYYARAGGISGEGERNITSCYNLGNVSAPTYKGGIIGVAVTVSSCYWLDDCGAACSIGNNSTSTEGKSTPEVLKSQTVVDTMNSALKTYYENNTTDTYYWEIREGENNGYPVIYQGELKPALKASDFDVSGISNKDYDGQAANVTASVKTSITGAGTVSPVKYKNSEGTDLDSAPKDVGRYTAFVNVEASEAYRASTITLGTFTISKAAAPNITPTLQSLITNKPVSEIEPKANTYGTYEFKDPNMTLNNAGTLNCILKFTPTDQDNYDWANTNGWTWDGSTKTLTREVTVNVVVAADRQVIVYLK